MNKKQKAKRAIEAKRNVKSGNSDDFMKVVQEIGKHDFGKPKKLYPNNVSFQNKDVHFPPDDTIQSGSKSIRSYWNAKALREGKRRKLNES